MEIFSLCLFSWTVSWPFGGAALRFLDLSTAPREAWRGFRYS